jgi:predicted transcriptional regulator
MATIQVQNETLEAIKHIALVEGSDVAATIERALAQFIAVKRVKEASLQKRWDEVIATIRAGVPAELSAEEIEADIDAAVAEVRAERLARGN